jgi:hypothetical protein
MVLIPGYFRKKVQKNLKSFEMRCWRRMEKISWTNCVKNDEESLESRGKGTSYIHYSERKLPELHILCIGTAF